MQRPEMIEYLQDYAKRNGINRGRELAIDMILSTLANCYIDDKQKVLIVRETAESIVRLAYATK